MSEIFKTFVDHGYLTSKTRTKFYWNYLLALKEMVAPTRTKKTDYQKTVEESDFSAATVPKIDNQHIIPVVWSLLLTEDPNNFTPIIFKLISDLATLDRPSTSLNEKELLMMHQINVFV